MKRPVLPCPMCGAVPVVGQLEPGRGPGTVRLFTVFCDQPFPVPHELRVSYRGKKAAIEMWNMLVEAGVE